MLSFFAHASRTINKKKEEMPFYSMPDYRSRKESLGGNIKGWTIKYYKICGLAGLISCLLFSAYVVAFINVIILLQGFGTSTRVEGKDYFEEIDKHQKEFVWEGEQDGDSIELAFILEEFFHLRLDFYVKRRKHVLGTLELELLKMDNKFRFILDVIMGSIIMSNRIVYLSSLKAGTIEREMRTRKDGCWSWMFWPWFIAIALAFYGLYCFQKHLIGEAGVTEQLAIVTSVFTWLTPVPAAYFNGYLEGCPFIFFFVYHYFFFFNVRVRKRLYGDYYARPHAPKWDVNPSKWSRLLFCAGVLVGHWFAAFEAPELHRIPGGWSNVGVWMLIVATLLMQYSSTLYLAKYSEKVVVPTAVVQFRPYRWIRHPVYVSTMLLFATNCLALRAPLSLLFVLAVCFMNYD
ncbi:hypothetical protein V6N12_051445 [Hibiscus sabdariffa]|uniref:DNA topoisomerase (ATP-hydrolyzing) n=1 Tax=Hibiscus sabdariffa TaxID=183260 RepID=A0ABR2GG61_9ROSI